MLHLLMASPRKTAPSTFPEHVTGVECPEPVEGRLFVYMVLCSDGTIYVGQSNDVRKRLERHRKGSGALHLRRRGGFKLIWTEGPLDSDVAAQRERQIKKWTQAKKLALARLDVVELKRLSRSKACQRQK